MLKLKHISNVIVPNVESDFYIPINFKFGNMESITEPRRCVSIRDVEEKSMFEIGIGERSGDLKYITLVSSPKIQLKMPTSNYVPTEIGLPSSETQEWKQYYTIVIKDFQVYIYKSSVLIVFSSNKMVKKIINDRVSFGFDEDEVLCEIEINNFTDTEKEVLEEILKANKSSLNTKGSTHD